MSAEYKEKQAALIAETITKQDIVITTALIPGRPAPKLISGYMVASMKPGSVIVDLAVETGGNCELVRGRRDRQQTRRQDHRPPQRAGPLADDASQLYARNLFNFLQLIIDKESGELTLDWEDEILKGTCVTRDGADRPRGDRRARQGRAQGSQAPEGVGRRRELPTKPPEAAHAQESTAKPKPAQ